MTRWLGVALLPSAEHTRSAVQLQTDVGEDHGLQPPLSPDGNLPHVTVFQGPFLDSLSPERELRTIADSMSLPEEIRLASTGIVYQPTGWVFLSLERPKLLSELQAAVLSVLAPTSTAPRSTRPRTPRGSLRTSGPASPSTGTGTPGTRMHLTSRWAARRRTSL